MNEGEVSWEREAKKKRDEEKQAPPWTPIALQSNP